MTYLHTNHDHPIGELTLIFEGDKFIKVTFPANGHYEHMWVRVNSFSDTTGTLQQDPVITSYVKDGDTVEFTKEAHRYLFTKKITIEIQ